MGVRPVPTPKPNKERNVSLGPGASAEYLTSDDMIRQHSDREKAREQEAQQKREAQRLRREQKAIREREVAKNRAEVAPRREQRAKKSADRALHCRVKVSNQPVKKRRKAPQTVTDETSKENIAPTNDAVVGLLKLRRSNGQNVSAGYDPN